MKNYVKKSVVVFRIHSVGRYDLLPIFSDVTLFNEIIDHLCKPYEGKVDCVLALEATGWILGVAMAQKLGVSFVPVRKGGKITLSG